MPGPSVRQDVEKVIAVNQAEEDPVISSRVTPTSPDAENSRQEKEEKDTRMDTPNRGSITDSRTAPTIELVSAQRETLASLIGEAEEDHAGLCTQFDGCWHCRVLDALRTMEKRTAEYAEAPMFTAPVDGSDDAIWRAASDTASSLGLFAATWPEFYAFGLSVKRAIQKERDAMQRRAEAAESDWHHWEQAYTALREKLTWQPIETAPKDGTQVLAWHEEGLDICWYEEACGDGIDDMGHDAGWFGVLYAAPGRSFGNPKYFREAQGQPTYWMPKPEPPELLSQGSDQASGTA